MRDLAQSETRGIREALTELEENLKLLLLPKDPMDEKNILLEIRAGTGGEEAALFAGDLFRMNDNSWHLVQSIPRVTGFIGGKNQPTPMRDSEAEKILSLMVSRQEQPRPKYHFERGDEVRVIDGPFGGFNGVVEDVNYDKGKLRVSVSIFGRQTPVELDFVQVSKN